MALKRVRAKAVLDALRDADVGDPLALKVVNAFAIDSLPGGVPLDISSLTIEEKSFIFIKALRYHIASVVQRAELRKVSYDATEAAKAGTAVDLGVD